MWASWRTSVPVLCWLSGPTIWVVGVKTSPGWKREWINKFRRKWVWLSQLEKKPFGAIKSSQLSNCDSFVLMVINRLLTDSLTCIKFNFHANFDLDVLSRFYDMCWMTAREFYANFLNNFKAKEWKCDSAVNKNWILIIILINQRATTSKSLHSRTVTRTYMSSLFLIWFG